MDTPSTALVLLHPQATHRFPDFFFVSVAFMAMVNLFFTTVAHCHLIAGDRTLKTTLLSRRTASFRENLAV